MDNRELKEGMRKLWKETFKDSDRYLDIVFDGNFDPELTEYVVENGKIVSMMTGVPYVFTSRGEKLKGLYLCGLATTPSLRGKGMMTELLKRMETKARNMGFSFLFLIPATPELRIYYGARGFTNAFYNVESRYTSIHDFNKEIENIIEGEERLDDAKKQMIMSINVEKLDPSDEKECENVSTYINTKEMGENRFLGIVHSKTDINKVIIDNSISGGEIYYTKNTSGNITGIAFIIPYSKESIKVQKIYSNDTINSLKLLSKIKEIYAEKSLIITQYPEESTRKVIWSEVYGAPNPDGIPGAGAYGIAERVYDVSHHSIPFGMAKILDETKILQYVSRRDKNNSFSVILDNGAEVCLKYVGKNGFITKSSIPRESSECQTHGVFSLKDLSEILFRKVDSSRLILEAFGLPRLGLNMALMLE